MTRDALRVLLIGYGPVGARLVEQLRPAVRSGAVALTVVGAESHDAYNRVLVAEYAVGRAERRALAITDTDAAAADGARIVTGARVIGIDRGAGIARLDSGESIAWDRLVFATGARANVPTLAGVDRVARDAGVLRRGGSELIAWDQSLPAGITALRDLADAERVREAVAAKRRIVVLGAGILGLEAALAAAQEGADVCVVHHGGFPMARNLDRGGGTVLAQALTRAGVALVARTRAEEVLLGTGDDGEPRFEALISADGKAIHGDLLLVSCGVSARTELATLAGLPTSTGILVDDELRSWGDDRVFAIGDCAHVVARGQDAPASEAVASAAVSGAPIGVRGAPSGLIGPGWRQAEWLADRLRVEAEVLHGVAALEPSALPAEAPALVMLKAHGIDVVSAGDVSPDPFDAPTADDRAHPTGVRQVSQWADPEHGRYLKLVTRGGVLEAFVSVGLPRTAAEVTLLYQRRAELPADRSILLRHDGPDESAGTSADHFAHDATVCWCNGVTVGRIEEAVDAGDRTVACVSASTRAGTGCGGCKGRIAELIERFADLGDTAEVAV